MGEGGSKAFVGNSDWVLARGSDVNPRFGPSAPFLLALTSLYFSFRMTQSTWQSALLFQVKRRALFSFGCIGMSHLVMTMAKDSTGK